MPLVLDGTNGVSGVDGTASNPAIEGTDSNTGIFYPAADTVAIGTGGTERVRVSSAGVFGVNTTSPAAIGANYGTIDIRGSSGGGFNLGTTGTLTGQIYGNSGGITYDAQGALSHFWYTNATERARITSGGALLVGSTSTFGDQWKIQTHNSITSDNRMQFTHTGTGNTSGDGLLVGIISNAGYLYNYENDSLIFGTNGTLRGYFTAGGNFLPGTDNTYSAGQSGVRWSAIWAANGTIQTSDARQKNTITDSDLGLSFISSLRPVSYKWNIGRNVVSKDDEGNEVITPHAGVRTHYGLIAQEVKEVLGDKDFGGFIHDSETDEMGLRYDQFISPLIKAIQELNAKVEAQAAEIAALKGNA